MAVIPPEAGEQSIISRRIRAAVKRDLKAGTLSLTAAFHYPLEALGDMTVYELLKHAPRLGLRRLAILNERALVEGVNICLPVVVLTERQLTTLERLCYDLQHSNNQEVPVEYDEFRRNLRKVG